MSDIRLKRLIAGAESCYGVDGKPVFVQEWRGYSPNQHKQVLLPDSMGNFPKSPFTPKGELIAKKWNGRFFYWIMNIDGEFRIVKPWGRVDGQAPYQEWRGVEYLTDRSGFAKRNLAFNIPPSQPSSGSPVGSGVHHPPSGPNIPNQLSDQRCGICRQRKVACDKKLPVCGRCRTDKKDCHYPGFPVRPANSTSGLGGFATPLRQANESQADHPQSAYSEQYNSSGPSDRRASRSEYRSSSGSIQPGVEDDDLTREERNLRERVRLYNRLQDPTNAETRQQLQIMDRLEMIESQKKFGD
ncbi:MAG: hypothetical protein Q9170_002181 [Blastenia crenularia]